MGLKRWFAVGMAFGGAGFVVAGVALFSIPVALIVFGVLTLGLGLFLIDVDKPRPE